ncbi:MAG: phosphotransferase [Cyanobacteria bacterium HKST-UBA02]|nr:phosphotransferase [Cyanobacteria bacterium HKST-UBA02]
MLDRENELLDRIAAPLSIDELSRQAASRFDLGALESVKAITTGYQDLNIKLTAGGCDYLLKVFSRHRSRQNIEQQIEALSFFSSHGIPVPTLVKEGIEIEGSIACVMSFFHGHDFTVIAPAESDMTAMAAYLARIHELPLEVSHFYDDWGAANLEKELELNRSVLSASDRELVEDAAARYAGLDLGAFRQCTIHGDLYREHVLKSPEGNYCIIDLGCMDYNAAVLDLAIFLAHFCLDEKLDRSQAAHIYKRVLEAYQVHAPLSAAELEALPILIAGSYASYIIATTHLIERKGDSTSRTAGWLELARNKLTSFNNWDFAYR